MVCHSIPSSGLMEQCRFDIDVTRGKTDAEGGDPTRARGGILESKRVKRVDERKMSHSGWLPFISTRLWAMLDLNQRPHPYQGCALTN